ncbi:Six-hairpin glycosidase [Polyplosphaeria fusca]|uniref:Six-hairpin glycosidase n=1 Tax=Polyplosphaeria fusca TaxID=682080 RepID=A0A9P4QYL2_9PLEO|nr:Six-hairpin glycosidase [Polyplosphaeria fusca]
MEIREVDLGSIFAENVTAKIIQVANQGMGRTAPLQTYPESVPQKGPTAGRYEHRDAEFWTCGFFPGSIYALIERAVKYPGALNIPSNLRQNASDYLLDLGRHWSVAINQMSGRTDTHDMGFIVQPALQKDWELTGSKECLNSVVRAAHALASRYDERVKAIRSWDVAINGRYSITDMDTNFLVIIDSMCNLDLLYYVGHHKNDQSLINIATTHANTILSAILRPDYSSYHLVNFDPSTGQPKAKMTNQGHEDGSTWSRGQAWSVMGFAQTYTWTKDIKYLDTAIRCAQYFLSRLEECKERWHHPMVPAWDFDAPHENPQEPLRDVSAGVIAANGMFVIHQSLQALTVSTRSSLVDAKTDFLDLALQIVKQTLDMSLDRDFASFKASEEIKDGESKFQVKESGFDAILRNSTANNNVHAHKRYQDHGLVYADYFLLEFGNKLLRAGLL